MARDLDFPLVASAAAGGGADHGIGVPSTQLRDVVDRRGSKADHAPPPTPRTEWPSGASTRSPSSARTRRGRRRGVAVRVAPHLVAEIEEHDPLVVGERSLGREGRHQRRARAGRAESGARSSVSWAKRPRTLVTRYTAARSCEKRRSATLVGRASSDLAVYAARDGERRRRPLEGLPRPEHGLSMPRFDRDRELGDARYPEQISDPRENDGFQSGPCERAGDVHCASRRHRSGFACRGASSPRSRPRSLSGEGHLRGRSRGSPNPELVIAWNHPMLSVDGKYVLGLSVAKHLTCC